MPVAERMDLIGNNVLYCGIRYLKMLNEKPIKLTASEEAKVLEDAAAYLEEMEEDAAPHPSSLEKG